MARLVFQPHTRDAIKSGIDTLAGAIAPTLGPLTGAVALDDATRGGSPELLDDGGTIARRILQLEDRHEDIGAMLLRESLWQQKARYGDGSATAAVLYRAVYQAGHRFISAGGDAMLLRRQLEAGLDRLLRSLRAQARPIDNSGEIERLAMSISGDAQLAVILADIFDALGPHQPIEIREGGRGWGHEFFLGAHWQSQVPSPIIFERQASQRLELRNTAWLISDFELDDLQDLVSLVTDVYGAGFESLAVIGKSFSEQIIAAQGANSRMEDFTLVFIQPGGLLEEQMAGLDDLALLTGGQVLRTITGHRLQALSGQALGKSELAWLDRERFGIIAGNGDAAAIQDEITALERRYLNSEDERQQALMRGRIGRLRGGSAIVYCGGGSESEMRFRQAMAERTITALRAALLHGVVPGGGVALLRCMAELQRAHEQSDDLHERAAWQILMTAAEAPCRQLLMNASHEAPGIVINDIMRGGNGSGFDLLATSGDLAGHSGVIDSAATLIGALRHGIAGAALALTVDTIVHRENPPLAIEPGGLPSGPPDSGNIELK